MTVDLDPAACLAATSVIDSDTDIIRSLAETLAAGAADAPSTVQAIFDYVRDDIRYDMGPVLDKRNDWRASSTVERGYGFCQQKAVVLAALLRARGIPAGVGMETVLDHKIPPHLAEHIGGQELSPHGYTIVFVDGMWQRVDASLDATLCERKGYRVVDYTPSGDHLLPATDLADKPHFDHVRTIGEWPDVPDEIVAETLALSYLRDPAFRQLATRNGPQI
jgi:transglutaminase-like putative cysteine protease